MTAIARFILCSKAKGHAACFASCEQVADSDNPCHPFIDPAQAADPLTPFCLVPARDVKLAAMNFFRTHCSPIAWILYAVVLFNGLACSIGHGQMMAAFAGTAVASVSHAGHGMSDMHAGHHTMHMSMHDSSKKMDMSGSMKAQSGECSFAGTLTLAMIFFVALGWLIRVRRTRFVLPDFWLGNLPRYILPGLNPQAP
ncbi:DUF2946 family protein [Pseudomonas syringae]|uniref:DUF2946 family protein n=1 Tax=Pseudomonas syringae TaxID=317 RepID=UPI001F484815|nr:DUF2946 family protein [Pseudomonas syringae]